MSTPLSRFSVFCMSSLFAMLSAPWNPGLSRVPDLSSFRFVLQGVLVSLQRGAYWAQPDRTSFRLVLQGLRVSLQREAVWEPSRPSFRFVRQGLQVYLQQGPVWVHSLAE